MNNALLGFQKAFQKGIKPKEVLTVSQWSDKHRILPRKTSSEPGRWDTKRTPYLREIMDCLSHMDRSKKVVFKKGAQVGGTECGNNWIGYIIDQDPGPTMIVWPSLPDVMTNTKLRITPLLESTPVLAEKIHGHKGRSEGSSARFKNFDGGALIINGSNSASGLRSVPARFLFLDEIDAYVDDVEGEGDPIALVMARSRTFSKRKAFLCSTPTFKGRSKIHKEFIASDQRHYHVPCPHCEKNQILIWDQINFEIAKHEDGSDVRDQDGHCLVESASYYCEFCGEEIEEHHKTKMLEKGIWIPDNPRSPVPGFHLSALYSPLGWYSWKEAAQDFVKTDGEPEKEKTFVNTVLGEVYEEKGEKPKHDLLYSRREEYVIGTVPIGAVFLTAAVDVQGDRLECEVIGWGRNRERWSIEHKVIAGRPSEEETWDDLERYLGSTFPDEDGNGIGILKCGIDSGYETQQVYNFCRRFDPSKVFPIKGRSDLQTMIGTPSAVDLKSQKTGKKERRGIRIWPVGVNMIKTELYGDLQKEASEDPEIGFPKGFIHFPQYDEEYFLQLTAEERRIKKDKQGFSKIVWAKIRERNEILDLHVYNRAVAAIIGIDRLNESGWMRLETQKKVASKLKTKENKKQDKLDQRSRKKKKKVSDFWD